MSGSNDPGPATEMAPSRAEPRRAGCSECFGGTAQADSVDCPIRQWIRFLGPREDEDGTGSGRRGRRAAGLKAAPKGRGRRVTTADATANAAGKALPPFAQDVPRSRTQPTWRSG